jgi:N-acetylneuraminate synthase
MSKPFIIAEIGSNCFKHRDEHRDFDNARRQIEMAREYGADAVKFQMYTAEELWGESCKDTTFAELQNKYALPFDWVPELRKLCDRNGIEFMCSAFSVEGYRSISPYVRRHKLASPEVRAKDICNVLLNQSKQVILSLGCITSKDLPVLLPKLRSKDVLLECVSKYPAEMIDYDFQGVRTLNTQRGVIWGVSDHTRDSKLAVYARSRGAIYFEKHVDFFPSEGEPTPDTEVSIGPEKFKSYVQAIHDQQILDLDTVKRLAIKLYARRRIKGGYARPYPEGAPGVE